MDQIICNAIRLLSNSEQANPKKAGLSSIRSLASLVPLVSFSMKHHRLAWLVNMSVLCAVYWCYIAVAVGAEESWNFQLPFGAAIVQGLPLQKTHLRIDAKLWDVFWLHENLKEVLPEETVSMCSTVNRWVWGNSTQTTVVDCKMEQMWCCSYQL